MWQDPDGESIKEILNAIGEFFKAVGNSLSVTGEYGGGIGISGKAGPLQGLSTPSGNKNAARM